MAFSQESGAQQASPIGAAKLYNGGAITLVAGDSKVTINIAETAANVPSGTGNGVYRISRATVAGGVVGAYAVLGTTPAPYLKPVNTVTYDQTSYVDNAVVNGTTYSYTVALDNNA